MTLENKVELPPFDVVDVVVVVVELVTRFDSKKAEYNDFVSRVS